MDKAGIVCLCGMPPVKCDGEAFFFISDGTSGCL